MNIKKKPLRFVATALLALVGSPVLSAPLHESNWAWVFLNSQVNSWGTSQGKAWVEITGHHIEIELLSERGEKVCHAAGSLGEEVGSPVASGSVRVTVVCFGTESDPEKYSGTLNETRFGPSGQQHGRSVVILSDGFNVIAITNQS